jgi:Glycosyl transferase family 2
MRPTVVPTVTEGLAPGTRPTFSVVVAAYEAAATIREAVESALAQSIPPLEVIVCDDGSTDDPAGALAEYRAQLTFLRQANAGEGASKNRGAEAASGDFIVFLDADDVFLPPRLEALGELAQARPDLDLLTTDAYLEVEGEVVRRCYDHTWTFPADDQRTAILERNFVFGLAAVRRDRFSSGGGFDESIPYAADWDLWCRLILGGSRAGLVAEPLARYRLHPTSLSGSRPRLLQGRCLVLEKALRRADLSEPERRVAAASLARARQASRLSDAREALRTRSPGARRLTFRVALTRSMPLRARVKALAAATAPAFASRLLDREDERHGRLGQAGVRFRP